MKNFKNVSKVFSILFAAVLVLAACGSGTTGKSGELRLATNQKTNSVNSLTSSEATNFQVIGNFQEGLMTYDAEGELKGSMAESWDVSADNTVYTFKLRDTEWSNGTPVTAHDFVFAWRALATTKDATYKSMLADIKNGAEIIDPEINMDVKELGVEAVSDKELKVTLVAPRIYFLDLMAFNAFSPINEEFFNSVGADMYGTSKDTVIANGPFILTEYAADTGYTLEKNPKYWDAKNVKLNKATTRVVETLDTQATLYEQGEIDRLQLLSADLVDRFGDSPDKVFQEESAVFYFYLSGNTKKEDKVLANKNFRGAVAHSIDKSIFTDQILKNGSLPIDYLVPKNFAFQNGVDFREASNQFNDPRFDVAKANELLDAAKAELGDEPLTFTLLTTDSETNKKVFSNIESQIETNLPGVDVVLELVPGNIFYNDLKKFETPAASAGWGADFRDVATYFSIFLSTDGHNYGLWKNEKFDELYAQAEIETDPAKRWEMFAEMEAILLDDYAIVPTFQRAATTLIKPNVKGYSINTTAPDVFFKYISVE